MSATLARLVPQLPPTQCVVLDLDGTLYDTRDFERPALACVAHWLRQRSGQSLEGLTESLWQRRETHRHKPGLFDDSLRAYELPAVWGAECAHRFRDYPGAELASCPSLREDLRYLQSAGHSLALVSNGRAELQARKLSLLRMTELFDMRVYCNPDRPQELKPSDWAWSQLTPWRADRTVVYVGDDPVDAGFARALKVPFVSFAFRNPVYGN